MKKITFLSLFMVLGLITANAQENLRFGLTAGFVNAGVRLETPLIDGSSDSSGFYFGAVADFKLSDQFSLEPKLTYTQFREQGEKSDFLQLPIMVKFYPINDLGFNVQAGPQITYTLEEVADDFTKLNIGLGAGLGYDFLEDFFVDARYHFQLNNYYTGSADITSKINFFTVGVGYKLD